MSPESLDDNEVRSLFIFRMSFIVVFNFLLEKDDLFFLDLNIVLFLLHFRFRLESAWLILLLLISTSIFLISTGHMGQILAIKFSLLNASSFSEIFLISSVLWFKWSHVWSYCSLSRSCSSSACLIDYMVSATTYFHKVIHMVRVIFQILVNASDV